MTGLITSEKMS